MIYSDYKFLKDLYAYCKTDMEDDAIDLIYYDIGTALAERNFKYVDIILVEIEMDDLTPKVMLLLLELTKNLDHVIPVRKYFIEDVRIELSAKMSMSEVHKLMRNLL